MRDSHRFHKALGYLSKATYTPYCEFNIRGYTLYALSQSGNKDFVVVAILSERFSLLEDVFLYRTNEQHALLITLLEFPLQFFRLLNYFSIKFQLELSDFP
jgi:hypothetical protein